MDSSPPTSPPALESQNPTRLRSRSIPPLSRLVLDDSVDSPTLTSPSRQLTIHELLLLPPSPTPRPKLRRRLAVEIIDQPPPECAPRHKSKNRAPTASISPRNGRRARRKLEKETVREVKEIVQVEDDAGKLKKRRQSRHRPARREKLSMAPPSLPSPRSTDKITVDGQSSLEGIYRAVWDLLMWTNVAKSSLWFGLGSIMFLSSIFSGEVGFSIISAASHLGILILSLAFFYDSIRQRKQEEKKFKSLQLKEDDVLHIIRIILPIINAALSKSQEIFSGEPLMTLKVAPVLLFLARYGHLTSPWRLLAIGFFASFTVPKLHSCYNHQIQQRVEEARSYVLEAWSSCSRKKLVTVSVTALLWNIFSVNMRIFAAFMTVVILRYHHEQQTFAQNFVEEEKEENDNKESMGGGEEQGQLDEEEEHQECREEKAQLMEL